MTQPIFMKKILPGILIFLTAIAAFGQPTIPVNNIYPVTSNSIIGRDGATGRAQSIPLGAGLEFQGGALVATGGGGGGAPSTATYITQTPSTGLSNEQALSLLGSGILRSQSVTGVITSLGDPSTVGSAFMFLSNPSAITFPRINADNSVTALPASNFKTALGLATVATSASASDLSSGTLPVARLPAFTGGDATTSAGSGSIIMNTVNPTVGTFGNSTTVPTITVDGKGRITSVVNSTISAGGSGNVTGSSLTANAVTLGAGSNSITVVASLGTSGQPLISAGAGAPPAFGVTTVPGGGTGLATITANSIMTGNGTGAVRLIAPGSSGNVLQSDGSSWISTTLAAGGNVTNNATLSAGNIVIGGGTTVVGTTTMSWNATNSTVTIGAAGAGNIIANVATFTTANATTMNVTTLNISTPIGTAAGGTGFSATTLGNIILGNNSTTYGQLGVGSNGQVLTANSSASLGVNWAAPSGNITGAGTTGQIGQWSSSSNITGIATTGSGNVALSPGGITITTGKVLAATNNLTFNGTDGTSFGFPASSGNVVTNNSTTTLTNKQQLVSGALGTDDTWEGIGITGLTAGATIAQWEAVYVDGSSTYQLADANGSGTYPARGLAVAAYSSTNAAIVITKGTVRNDAWSWTPGGTIYLSTTAGGLTQTAPSTSGDKVQQVGFALTADIAHFDFASGEYLTVQ